MAEISGGNRYGAEGSFDLNLAPFLDIIVSIVPLLLLGAVLFEVKILETPIPQVVADAIKNSEQNQDKKVVINLGVSSTGGYEFMIENNGKKETLATKSLDLSQLRQTARKIKDKYPDIFQIQFNPDKNISFEDIVKTMDSLRKIELNSTKISFLDRKSGQMVQTDLMFPNIIFGNVVGD